MERIVCCCIKCANVKLKLHALNQVATRVNMRDVHISIDDLAAKTLCPPVNGQPSMKCLKRECTLCGVDAVQQRFLPVIQDLPVKFDEWKMTAQEITVRLRSKDAAGKIEKKTVRITSTGTISNVTDVIC